MIASRVRARSGITLTEILISILIMGVGMISLAVLFPLGLLKLRDAARFHRSGLLAQSGTDDFDAKGLTSKESFIRTWYGPVDPFTSDATYGMFTSPVQTLGAGNLSGFPQPGLPVCYDPLWRAVTNISPTNDALFDPTLAYLATYRLGAAEARFGASIIASGNTSVNAFAIRSGTSDGGNPSAYGLQRITNFIPWSPQKYTPLYPFTFQNIGLGAVAQPPDVTTDTFTSLDDIVFNSRDNGATGLSPLLPDLTLSLTTPASPVTDYRYTWFFTGRQVDSINGTMFTGDIVVCEGRQFGFTPLPAPNTTVSVPEGETVVEGIFGYSENVNSIIAKGVGNGVGSDKTVLLRWPTTITDPSVRIGSWIADVTYERNASTSNTRATYTQSSFQRCNWYQVSKRTDPQADPDSTNFPNYRRMIVTIASPVKSRTVLGTGGIPVYVNAALIMPSVINVYPRAFSQ
jgi:hypothetical protein